jgi:hypothetical protein
MVTLVHSISQRIAKYLEKVGLVERDMESSFLNLPLDDEDSLLHLQGASVSYRIAMGPQQVLICIQNCTTVGKVLH